MQYDDEIETTLRINVNSCKSHRIYRKNGDEYHQAYGEDALNRFIEALEGYGMEVSADYSSTRKSAKIKIRHKSSIDAKYQRVRNPNGRPKKQIDSGITIEWLESHSVEEGMERMRCSRRTYYRRLAEIRKAAAVSGPQK